MDRNVEYEYFAKFGDLPNAWLLPESVADGLLNMMAAALQTGEPITEDQLKTLSVPDLGGKAFVNV